MQILLPKETFLKRITENSILYGTCGLLQDEDKGKVNNVNQVSVGDFAKNDDRRGYNPG